MANVIIGIHGLSNKPEPRLLSDWWEKSIREGLRNRGVENPDFDFEMVNWSMLLYKTPQHNDPDFKHDSAYLNQPYIEAAEGALKAYTERRRDRIREWVTDRFAGLAERIGGSRFAALEERIIASKGWEVPFYYDESKTLKDGDGQSQPARKVLVGTLTNAIKKRQDDRLMLISHSMGTTIAYDALRDLGREIPNFKVAQFVTMGSPLGLTFVKSKIKTERDYDRGRMRVRTPSVVTEKWVNYADRTDPVAAESHLRGDYGPNPAGIQVVDDLTDNDYTAPDGERIPHKSFGYLRTPELSDQIKDFLQG
ncbi:MAG: hypothetical protein IH872_05165 [Chloroflexi bacterium]|nr:hypothetical protein [Chloroflexota bacterium]